MKIPYSSRVMASSLTLVAWAVATAPAVATAADFSGLTIYDNSGGAHAFNATGLEMTPQGDKDISFETREENGISSRFIAIRGESFDLSRVTRIHVDPTVLPDKAHRPQPLLLS